ncbi:MAG: nitroreductase family protein [Verrucomicrobiota bacterium]
MNYYQTVEQRYSVRAFKATPVNPESLARIWEAVRLAPSACNLQPWRFLVIKTAELRAKLAPILQPWVFTAPLVVVALGNRQTAWRRDGQSYHELDVAIAFEHLVLAATAEGLGTCWICAFDRKAMAKALELTNEWDPVAVTPLGYPAVPCIKTPRRAIAEIVQEI